MELHLKLVMKDDASPREIARALMTAAVDAGVDIRRGEGPDEPGEVHTLMDASADDDAIIYAAIHRIV